MTVIVGGGQAGLAVGAALQDRGQSAVILEAAAEIGDVWRGRWQGLRLFTPARYSSLPGLPFGGRPYHLPDRLEVADYLAAFAKTRGLDVRTGQQVNSVRKETESGFEIETEEGHRYLAGQVVIATGANRTPHRPGFAERLPPSMPQIHTAELRNPHAWLPTGTQHLLVIGAGASGSQIAALLRPHVVAVTLAGRDTGHLPRSLFGRDVYDYLYGLGIMSLRVDRWPGSQLVNAVTGDVTVGESLEQICARLDIRRTARIDDYVDGAFVTTDRERLERVDAVVYATGYRNRYPFLRVPAALNDDGSPQHERGISPVRGLYWMGLPYMRTISSALIGGVGADAEWVAGQIVDSVAKPAAAS